MDKVELVLKIVAQICPFVQIGPETELIDSGILTSVDLFDLITELETEFISEYPHFEELSALELRES